MKKDKLKIIFKILIILLIITFIFFIIKTIYDVIELLNCKFCSAPWYTAIVINSVIFIIPIILELILIIYFYRRIKT